MKAFELAYIADDDPITSKITELIIKKSVPVGEIRKCLNGKLALEMLRTALQQQEKIPDLILLDLNMPVMDGWEFLDAFSTLALPNEVCVCVLTSSIDPEDIEKSTSYKEVKGYFSKPLDDAVLQQVLHLLEQSE